MEKVTTDGTAVQKPEAKQAPASKGLSKQTQASSSSSDRSGRRSSAPVEFSPTPNVTASIKVQQLADINRKIQSASAENSINRLDALIQQRDALVMELESLSSVDVIQRSDGTVRVRTTEGNTLIDSEATQDGRSTAEMLPPPPPIDPEPTTVNREAASASYSEIDGNLGAEPNVSAEPVASGELAAPALREPLPSSTGIPSVDRVADLESKAVALEKVEAVMSDSMTQLGAIQTRQGDIDALIG